CEQRMAHLDSTLDQRVLGEQLPKGDINSVERSSDFPFLKQAFTEGERWPVRRERLEKLRAQKLITDEQFQEFASNGAIGSHLENLQRKGGFKGFNQHAVSLIFSETDPRKQRSFAGA